MKRIAIALLLLASAGICCGQTKPTQAQVEALPQYRCEPSNEYHPRWSLDARRRQEVWTWDSRQDCEQAMNLIAKEEPDPPKHRWSVTIDAPITVTEQPNGDWVITPDKSQTEPMTGLQPHCTDHISYFGVHLWTGPDGNIKGATEAECEAQLNADREPK